MKIPTKRGYTLIEVFVVLGIIAIVAAVFFPVTTRCGMAPRPACQSNLKQLGLAMLQYAQDNSEKFPPIASNAVSSSTDSFSNSNQPYGWADAIQPYAKSTQILQCPSEADKTPGADATQSGFTDYWFNTNLNARPLKEISQPGATFLLGEGNDARDGSDARYNRNVLPQSWIDHENSPSYRHLKTGNYLFADGHVKALPPKTVVDNHSFAAERR